MEFELSTPNGAEALPLIVEPRGDSSPSVLELVDYVDNHREWMDSALHRHGGILLRGFAVRDVKDFQEVSHAVIPELKPYVEGQSPRTKVADNVYTSTEFPPQYRITLHNELSYAKTPPRRIMFYCLIEPTEGGETPIVDCRTVYSAMDPAIRERFERSGVRYVKAMHGQEHGLGKSWAQHFETNDKQQVENYLREGDIDFEWTPDGSLRTSARRPATIRHPVTDEMLWFNQANLWHVTNIDEKHRGQILKRCGEENLPTHAYYGDGDAIDEADLNRVRDMLWQQAVMFPWRQGDVLVLDNYLAAHGRMPYSGARKILVAMG